MSQFTDAVMDFLASLTQGGTRQVTYRYNSDRTLAIHHRKVPEVAGQHDFKRFLNRYVGTHRDGVSGHPLSDRLARRGNVIGQSADEIALGKDSFEPSTVEREHRAHSAHSHHGHRRGDGA